MVLSYRELNYAAFASRAIFILALLGGVWLMLRVSFRAALIYFPWLSSDEYLTSLDEAAYEAGKKAMGERWVKDWDANSMLSRYMASRNFDAAKPFGGEMMKALTREYFTHTKAKMLDGSEPGIGAAR